jgi:hypothetical protein
MQFGLTYGISEATIATICNAEFKTVYQLTFARSLISPAYELNNDVEIGSTAHPEGDEE